MTKEEVERLVIADYEQLKGKLIRVTEVECFNEGDSSTMYLTDPIVLRISDSMQPDQGILRWTTQDWCDPAYDVRLVESSPEADAWLADGDYHVSWVSGPSRSTTGAYSKPPFKVVVGS